MYSLHAVYCDNNKKKVGRTLRESKVHFMRVLLFQRRKEQKPFNIKFVVPT